MIAVTGSEGFIGRHVVEVLEKLNYQVARIDHHVGVSLDSEEAAYLIRRSDAVIHLAGHLGTSELFDDPFEAVNANVNGTLAVLKACEKVRTRYVGITMPSVWMNVYQATKRCAFEMAEAWRLHRGVRTSYVRAYNVFGPGQKYGLPQKIIPTFAVRSYRGEPIPIWGDGQQTVDLVHVEDVAKILVDALHYGDGELFDAGTGEQQSVLKVAGMVHSAVFGGPRPELVAHLPMRPGEDEGTRVAAMGEGWDLLGWHPTFDVQALYETVYSYRELGTTPEPYESQEATS